MRAAMEVGLLALRNTTDWELASLTLRRARLLIALTPCIPIEAM
jgi:hypothetical protein